MPCQSSCNSGSSGSSSKYIRRGTTPKQVFTVKNVSDIHIFTRIQVTYSQRNRIILVRELEDMTIEDNNTFSFRLTQEETLSFRSGVEVEIQVRAYVDGLAPASGIYNVPAERILNEEVLS